MRSEKKSVLSGVLFLTLSGVFVKVIGLLFKIPLQAVLTDEGMGYFNAAYSIYLWFYTVSTAGLPVAVSLLVSKSHAHRDLRAVRVIFRTTMGMLALVGAVLGAAMLLFAPALARAIGTPSTTRAIAVIAPTVFFVCLSGGIRGYFQGMGEMRPTALSQVVEALCKLGLGIAAARFSLRRGDALPTVAAYAVSGLTVGTALGTLLLIACYRQSRHRFTTAPDLTDTEPLTVRAVAARLWSIALPVTVSASVMSLTGVIDVGVVIRRLRHCGYAEEAAIALYGNYTTLAVPMFHLPPTLITPIACALVPPLTAALERGDATATQRLNHAVLRVGMLLLLPCSVGLSVMAHPILSLFFATPSVELAAPLLSVLALSVPFVGLVSITNAQLQVYRQERKPILSMLCGAAVKLVVSTVLIGMPAVGIYGAPIGTLLCYGTIAMLNLAFVQARVGSLGKRGEWLWRPFVASLGCGASATLARTLLLSWLPASLATLVALAIAALCYGVLLLLLGGAPRELLDLPPVRRLYDWIRKKGGDRFLLLSRRRPACKKERNCESNGELQKE